VYHSTSSPSVPGVALSVELAPLQIVSGLAIASVGSPADALTVTVAVAHVSLAQPVVVLFVRA